MTFAPSLPFSRPSSFGFHVHDRPVSYRIAASVRTPRAADKESESTYHTTISIPMAVAASFQSLYDILGIHSAASGPEIKAAYRRLARECHPDVVALHRKDISADQFMRIHAAYTTLSDREKRADYDRSLPKTSNRRVIYRSSSYPSHSSSSSSAFTPRRSWESDQCW